MIDQNFGALCSVCKRRDYIPYDCKKCNKKFCDDHYRQQQVHPCVQHRNERRVMQMKGKKYYCCECKGRIFTVNHFYCPDCQKLLCLKHRHPETHQCKNNQESSCSLI